MKIWETVKNWFKKYVNVNVFASATVVNQVTLTSGNTPQNPPDRDQLYYEKESKKGNVIFWLAVVVVYIFLYFPGFFLDSFEISKNLQLSWWHIVLFAEVFYTTASLSSQKQNEVGARTFFGKVLSETGPGLVFVPRFMCEHIKESSLLQQWEIPTDLPKLYKDEKGVSAKTLRMTTAPASKTSSGTTNADADGDPLQTGRLTLEVRITILAQLDKRPGGFFQFIEQVGSIDNFLQIADDDGVNTFRKEVAKKPPSEIFESWGDIEDLAKTALKDRIGGFGFANLDVRAKEFDLPKRVNEALADRTAMFTNVETQRLDGLGQQKRDLLIAVSKKALKAAELDGTIEALTRSKSDTGLGLTNEQAVFLAYQEVIASALKNANYTLLPQGQGGMLDPASMMSIMQEAIKASGVEKKSKPKPGKEVQK